MRPVWLRSPLLRTDLQLVALTGDVRDHGDAVAVRSPDEPAYYFGNYLLLRGAPSADEVPRRIAQARAAFADLPGVAHVCLVWEGPGLDPSAHAAAIAAGAGVEETVALELTDVVPPASPFEVRPLGPDDHDASTALNRAADPTEDDDPSYRAWKERRRVTWRRWIEEGHVVWYGAFRDGVLMGQCGMALLGDIGRFQEVETHPDHRRQGVCTALIANVARRALDAGAARVVLGADPDGPALALYRRLGFRETEGGPRQALLIGRQPLRIRARVPADDAAVRALRARGEARPGSRSFVADQDGLLLGHVRIDVGEAGAELGSLVVRPSHRRLGVGTKLLRVALAAAAVPVRVPAGCALPAAFRAVFPELVTSDGGG